MNINSKNSGNPKQRFMHVTQAENNLKKTNKNITKSTVTKTIGVFFSLKNNIRYLEMFFAVSVMGEKG